MAPTPPKAAMVEHSRPLPANVERIRIARGRVGRMRPLLYSIVVLTLASLFGSVPLGRLLGVGDSRAITAGIIGVVAMVVALIAYLNMPGHVLIGSDGIYVDKRDEQRYLAFSRIERIEPYEMFVMGKHFIGVEVHVDDGSCHQLPIGEDQFGAGERCSQLVDRLRAALTAYRRLQVDEARVAPLERGERSAEQWLNHLRSIGAGAHTGPRTAAVPHEQLWAIVETPTHDANTRASAAAALGSHADDEGKQRLRFIANSTAQPELRIALDSAAEGEHDALLEALDDMSKAPQRPMGEPGR